MRQRIENDLPLTVSVGVAEATSKEDMHAILSRSDSALYSAKSSGRNQVFVHTGDNIDPVGKVIDINKCAIKVKQRWPELAPRNESDSVVSPSDQVDQALDTLVEEINEVNEEVRQGLLETDETTTEAPSQEETTKASTSTNQ